MSSSADLPAAQGGLRLRTAGVNPESVLHAENNTTTADDSLKPSPTAPAGQEIETDNGTECDGKASNFNKTYGRTPDGTGTQLPPQSSSVN